MIYYNIQFHSGTKSYLSVQARSQDSQKGFTHRLAMHFKYPTVCKWSTAAIENHRCPSELGCSYTPRFFQDD